MKISQTKDKPWWTKVKVFNVPESFYPLIKDLPENDQVSYCYIVSKIIRDSKSNPLKYANVGSKYWLDGIGGSYSKYLNNLEVWNVIEVNGSYLSDKDKGFTKSYRMKAPHNNNTLLIRLDFKKKRIKTLKDETIKSDDIIAYVHSCLSKLTIKSELVTQDDIIDYVESIEWANKVFFGKFNVRYGNDNPEHRLFHSIICMPKECRRNLEHKDNKHQVLFEYDFKTAHPVLLLTLCKDLGERQRLTDLLNNDFYKMIAKEMKVEKPRDEIKQDALKFLNGMVDNYFFQYFRTHFPILTEKLQHFGKGTAQYLQSMEAFIMVRTMVRYCQKENLFFVPQHDGWLGVEHQESIIGNQVKSLVYDLTGYDITITRKNIQTGEETTI